MDIDQPTDTKITDREYHARRRGQKEKDIRNAQIRADGYEPIHPNYETAKQLVRNAVDDAASRASTELDFLNILRKEYKINVAYKRKRYSYVHPDSKQPFTARSLGNAYERDAILEKLRMNCQPIVDDRPELAALPRVFLIPSNLRLVVDLQSCVKAQQSRAYAQKVSISNLQKMANIVAWLQENNMESIDKLRKAKLAVEMRYYEVDGKLKAAKCELFDMNMKIKRVGRYYSNKKVYERHQQAEDKTSFRAEYRSQIEAYEESVKILEDLIPDGNYPSLKELREQKAGLVEKRDKLQAEFKPIAADMRSMNVVWKNVCYILGRNSEVVEEEKRKRQQQERERQRHRRRDMSL